MGNNPAKETTSSGNRGGPTRTSNSEIQRQNEAFLREQREKFESDYQKVLEEATITGNSWIEFEHNLKEHIQSPALRTEWNYMAEKESHLSGQDLYRSAVSPANKDKNRYVNILPFEATRVKLTEIEGVVGSDYINANHVATGERPYICCSAPVRETLADFHRMLWETKVKLIVMLTKFVEGGKPKAIEYLPGLGEPTKYGDIEVELKEEEKNEEVYVIRKFTLKKGDEVRNVTQFHFLAWPDFGVPHLSKPLLDMILKVNNLEDEYAANGERAPTVVHCSAGIGRTGTYIAVGGILEHITLAMKKDPNTPPSINLMKTIHEMRTMRAGMVNALDQYEYCYNTILEHVQGLLGIKVEKPEPAKQSLTESSNENDSDNNSNNNNNNNTSSSTGEGEEKPKKKKKKKKVTSTPSESNLETSTDSTENNTEGGEVVKKKKKKSSRSKKEKKEGEEADTSESKESPREEEPTGDSSSPKDTPKKKKKASKVPSEDKKDKEKNEDEEKPKESTVTRTSSSDGSKGKKSDKKLQSTK